MSAGVAERPLVGCDLSITDCMGSSGDGFGLVLLAQTVTSELQSVSIVDDAVEDGVGQGRLANQVVPAVDWDLASDQRGAAAVTVFKDFQQIVTLLGPERLETPIIEDQQLDAAERAHQPGVAADCSDQIADVGRDRGPTDTTARLPTPVQTEAAPMPAHQRLRLEDNRGL